MEFLWSRLLEGHSLTLLRERETHRGNSLNFIFEYMMVWKLNLNAYPGSYFQEWEWVEIHTCAVRSKPPPPTSIPASQSETNLL